MQTTPKATKSEVKINTQDDLIERYKKYYKELSALFNQEVRFGINTIFEEQTKRKIHKLLGEEEAGFVLWYLMSQQLVTQPIYLFMKFLQKYGADFSLVYQNQTTFIYKAISGKSDLFSVWLFKDLNLCVEEAVIIILLQEAFDSSNIATLDYLITHVPFMCANKNTALMYACMFQNEPLARGLLRANSMMIDQANKDGFNPLMIAVGGNNMSLIKLFLLYKPNILKKDFRDRTVFHYAVGICDLNVLNCLYQHAIATIPEFSINQINQSGVTLLHWAIQSAWFEGVKFLVEQCRADLSVKDHLGRNYATFAIEYSRGDFKLVDFFTKKYHLDPQDDQLLNRVIHKRDIELFKLIQHHFKENFRQFMDKRIHIGHVLAQYNETDLLRTGIKEGWVDLYDQDQNGLTLLDVAVGQGVSCIETIRFAVDYMRKHKNPLNPHWTLRSLSCYLTLLEFFLTDEVLSSDKFVENGQTIVHLALEHSDGEWIDKFLTQCKGAINNPNAQGERPLCSLLRQNNFQKTMHFIKKFQPKTTDLDSKKSTLLHLACEMQDFALIKVCVEEKQLSFLKAREAQQTAFEVLLDSKHAEFIAYAWGKFSKTDKKRCEESLKTKPLYLQLLQDYDLVKPVVVASAAKVLPKSQAKPASSTPKSVSLPKEELTIELCIEALEKHDLAFIRDLKSRTDFPGMVTTSVFSLLQIAFKTDHNATIYQFLRVPFVQEYMRAQGQNLLFQAIELKDQKFLECLLREPMIQEIAGADNNMALCCVIRTCEREFFDALYSLSTVQAALSTNAHAVLKAAIDAEKDDILSLLLSITNVRNGVHLQDNALLISVITDGQIDALLELLKIPAVVESLAVNDFNVFRCAVRSEQNDIIHVLIAYPQVREFVLNAAEYTDKLQEWFGVEFHDEGLVVESPALNVVDEPSVSEPIPIFFAETNQMQIMQYTPYAVSFPGFVPYFLNAMPHTPWLYDPMLMHLEQLRQDIQANNFMGVTQGVCTLLAPPMFSEEIFNLLLLCIEGDYLESLNILLTSPIIMDHAQSGAHLLLQALAVHGSTASMDLLLSSCEHIKRSIMMYDNQCVIIAMKYRQHDLVTYLLSIPCVFEQAHTRHNYLLRMAIKQAHIPLIELLLTSPSVAKDASIWGNSPLRQAVMLKLTAAVDLLLNIPIIVYNAIKHSDVFAILLQAKLNIMMSRLDHESIDPSKRSHYFLMMKFCIKHPNEINMNYMRKLLSLEEIRSIAHLHVSFGVKNNELLQEARFYNHQEIVRLLLDIPQVKQCFDETTSLSRRSIFAPPLERTESVSAAAAVIHGCH